MGNYYGNNYGNKFKIIMKMTLIVGFDAFSSNHRACLRAAICEIIMLSFTIKLFINCHSEI